jgi:hypothetical protein
METIFLIGLALVITAAIYFRGAKRRRLRALILRRLDELKPAGTWRGIGGK